MSNIRGSLDNIAPRELPDDPWKTWAMFEVYDGRYGKDRYIPKLNDHVIEHDTGNLYLVTAVNVDGIPTLRQITIRKPTGLEDIFSDTNENYRLYQDLSVTPPTLSVDGMMKVYSSRANHAVIYRGTSEAPEDIVSEYFDSSGFSQGPGVPLELVAMNNTDNYAIKSVRTCNLASTAQPMDPGDNCTVTIYTDDGKIISRTQVLVENISFVRQAHTEQKYLIDIYLESPFISVNDSTTINFPLNVDITGFRPILVRVYNDGSVLKNPIDGGKFALLGLDSYSTNMTGEHPLVLRYTLDPDESGITTIGTINGNVITRPYTIKTKQADGMYDVKLHVFPVYNGTNYSMKVVMLNLDRTINIDVTDKVTKTSSFGFPSSLTNGEFREFTVKLDVSDVSKLYKSYVHTETMWVRLNAYPTSNTNDLWEVKYNSSPSSEAYGLNLKATLSSNGDRINVGNGYSTWQEFLDNTYYKSYPLYDPSSEVGPVSPAYLRITYEGHSVIVGSALYKNDIRLNTQMTTGKNVMVEFLTQTAGGYLVLSAVAMTVR